MELRPGIWAEPRAVTWGLLGAFTARGDRASRRRTERGLPIGCIAPATQLSARRAERHAHKDSCSNLKRRENPGMCAAGSARPARAPRDRGETSRRSGGAGSRCGPPARDLPPRRRAARPSASVAGPGPTAVPRIRALSPPIRLLSASRLPAFPPAAAPRALPLGLVPGPRRNPDYAISTRCGSRRRRSEIPPNRRSRNARRRGKFGCLTTSRNCVPTTKRS